MFRDFNVIDAQGQLVPIYFPDELSLAILNHLSYPELTLISQVNGATKAMVDDVILQRPMSALIEFLIFHPEKGFEFLAWLLTRGIIYPKLDKLPDGDPWRVLFASLVVEDVNLVNRSLIRSALESIDKMNSVSDNFKKSIERIIKIILVSSAQPFFFTGLLKTDSPSLFLNLPHARFSFLAYKDVNFKYANLAESDFDFSILASPMFSFSNLSQAKFLQAKIEGGDFSGADLYMLNMTGAHLAASTLKEISAESTKFSATKLIGNNFSHSVFFATCFEHAKIISCKFKYSILLNSDFSFSEISDSDFSASDLRGSNFLGASFRGVKFIHAILDGVDFGSCLNSAGCSGLNFTRASLVGCNFEHQNLRDASFKESNASYVDFTSADLRGADFYGVNLIGAKFDFAKLAGFEYKEEKFLVLQDAFLNLHPFDQKTLNLSVILVLQFHLSKLIDEKLPANSKIITALDALIGSIHVNLPCSLYEIMDDWRVWQPGGENTPTYDEIIRQCPMSTYQYVLSFFTPVPRVNNIADLIDDIYQAALASQYRPSTMPS